MGWFGKKINFEAPEPDSSDYIRALGVLKNYEAASGHDSRYQNTTGWCFYSLGELKQAAMHFERALQIDDNCSVAMHGLAWVYEKSDFDKSIFGNPNSASWHSAIKGMGNNTFEFSNIGLGFSAINEHKIAIFFFNKSLQEDSSNDGVYALLAFEYLDAGQAANAKKFLDIAIKKFPDDGDLVRRRKSLD